MIKYYKNDELKDAVCRNGKDEKFLQNLSRKTQNKEMISEIQV
jgi:hypothetical protein